MSEATTATPKKSKKTLVIAAAAVLLLGGGGAGAFLFLNKGKAETEGGHGAQAAAAPRKKDPSKKPSFVNLDPFTVNLRDERGERFAQIGVTFEVDEPGVEVEIKDRLPTVRNNILLLISSKRIEELLSPEGKAALAQEIRIRAGQALGHEPVMAMAGLPAAAPGQMSAPQAMPQQPMLPGQMVPGQMVPGQMVPGQMVPGQVAPGQVVPGQMLQPAVAGQLVPHGVAPAVPATATPGLPAGMQLVAGPDNPIRNVLFSTFIVQ